MNVLFYNYNYLCCEVLELGLVHRVRYVDSSGCKPDALVLSYSMFIPSTLSSMLTMLRLTSSNKHISWVYITVLSTWFEEGDGRCVRTSLLYSIKLSILNLLLNPPLFFSFIKIFVYVLY